MERDCYQVQVLHYLNPHLIWVEVLDATSTEFVFEQIGIYGILPFETTIDTGGGSLKAQRCEDWVGASTLSMKQSFSDAKQVWFQPTHIDRRTSIFDDNVHKYGEIIIKTRDKKQIELSKVLMKSGFALYDICLFHQELGLGNLKTKLTHAKKQEVIKQLEKQIEKDSRSLSKKKREESVKKQTSVFRAVQNLETSLTEKNLKRYNSKLISNRDIDSMLEKKSKDFDRCKDIDDESVGRAICSKIASQEKLAPDLKKEDTQTVPTLLKRKLDLIRSQENRSGDPLQVLMATKQYLEDNAKTINKDTETHIMRKCETEEMKETEAKKAVKTSEVNETNLLPNTNSSSPGLVNAKEGSSSENESNHKPLIWHVENKERRLKPRSRSRHKKSPKIPEYDPVTEKRVAFGPPGFDRMRLSLKVIPKKPDEEESHPVSKFDDEPEESIKTKDMFNDVDSNVHIEITNKDALKEKFNSLRQSVALSDTKDKNESLNDSNSTEGSLPETNKQLSRFEILQKKLKLFKENSNRKAESAVTSTSDTTNKDSSSAEEAKPKKERITNSYFDSDEENISNLVEKINLEYSPRSIKTEPEKSKQIVKEAADLKNNVNPFKNVDANMSVFVEKLVSPVLMVHSKIDKRIEPCANIRDVTFNTHIHIVLKNMGVERPMMMQMVSWPIILRGYSLFMIGPLGSGKTLGYLPAICRLISDFKSEFVDSVGPTCIIVCATAQSVTDVENVARMFLGLEEKVVACFAGVNELDITTALLNGCDLFICTPSVLVRLLQLTDFGVDLRRLSAFVLEDCERLSDVYANELKYFLHKIREMLKVRANKELKVQIIVASRIWCDFFEPLAKKAPNSVICVGAFQECVLYSKANMSVDFVKKENKINKVLDFLNGVDGTKKTVIVCRSDDEVEELLKVLTKNKYVIFACNNTMTVEELYNLSKTWDDYQEPLLGPILVCCDGNLNHLNVTDVHFLIHYSLPQLFSLFCKRFSVLNDNYPSIFKDNNENVKIKVFLEDSNMEQLPKILNFIKRCTNTVPEFLGDICEKILEEKDSIKAMKFVPICDNTLALGECPDFWNCQERHGVFKEYDEPKEWMPTSGMITFKILHYHTPIQYSVRLLSNTSNGETKKYPQTYSTLSLKLGMYYSKESNRKLHGIPKVGDVCAVSVKVNFFVRCQVLKILTQYKNGTPNYVLIKMIDEEKLEKTRDIYLFYLPEELKNIETHIVQVRLANVCPKDRDVTFSNLAKESIKKITRNDEDIYMRGQVLLTIGNCIFVDTLEACQDLTSLNETVVKHNLKKELLESHAIANPDHIPKLEKLSKSCIVAKKEEIVPIVVKKQKIKPKPQWAHLENEDISAVFFASAENPGTFFIRLAKFESCMKLLLKDIIKYIEGSPNALENVTIGEIVLAKFPDDSCYERARVDDILSKNLVKCFFVDQGDWRDVQISDLVQIPSRFVTQMPFQAIECRLIGVKPVGDDWTEFGTNWFYDTCFEPDGNVKLLYCRYFTKEQSTNTGGHKYGVAIIDTNGEQDVVINHLMIDLNLAQENDDEIGHLQEVLNLKKCEESDRNGNNNASSDDDALDDLPKPVPMQSSSLVPVNTVQDDIPKVSLDNIFLKKPIRSVPLVDSDNESSASWDMGNAQDFVSALKSFTSMNIDTENIPDPTSQNGEKITKPSPVSERNATSTPNGKNNLSSIEKASVNNKSHDNLNSSFQDTDDLSKTTSILTSTLDSDDFSSAEGSQISLKATNKQNLKLIEKVAEKTVITKSVQFVEPTKVDIDEKRKPKLLWRQNKTSVSIKIQLIGVEDYILNLVDRTLKFDAICNDTKYGFKFELYGVVNNCVHSSKGQYILVKLNKLMKKNWLTLTKDGAIRKWIVYDVDSIDTSSDEEEERHNTLADVVRNSHDKERDSESDEDFLDDIEY